METIEIKHLSYRNKEGVSLLKDVSFTISKNDRIALLGCNGAGKTTLFEAILGYKKDCTGSVVFNGHKLSIKDFPNIGIVWDHVDLFPWLKVEEILNYFLALNNLTSLKNEDVCKLMDIKSTKNKLAKVLSTGEAKKLAIVLATINNPSYLFLDELSSNLDEISLNSLWEGYLLKNKTVFFSTHKWEEAEQYANKFLFLYKGRILLPPSTKEELFNAIPYSYKIVVSNEYKEIAEIHSISFVDNGQFIIFINESDGAIIEFISAITNNYSILPIELMDIYNYLSNKTI